MNRGCVDVSVEAMTNLVAKPIYRRHYFNDATLSCSRCGKSAESFEAEEDTPCLRGWKRLAWDVKYQLGQWKIRWMWQLWRLLFRLNIGDPYLYEGRVKTLRGFWECLRANPHRRYRDEINELSERLAKALRSQTQTERWKARALRAEATLKDLEAWREAGCPNPEEWVRQNPSR